MATIGPLPKDDAPPAIIHDFLADILIINYKMDDEQAYEIAQGWQFGRGFELRTYGIGTFLNCFGTEAGYALYTYVHKDDNVPKELELSVSYTIFGFLQLACTIALTFFFWSLFTNLTPDPNYPDGNGFRTLIGYWAACHVFFDLRDVWNYVQRFLSWLW